MIIAPELEDKELDHKSEFWTCTFCGQLLISDPEPMHCPNCELENFLAIKWLTALWILQNLKFLKAPEIVGIGKITNLKIKQIFEKAIAELPKEENRDPFK